MRLLMKKLVFMAFAVSLVACGGAKEAPKKAVPTCSADCGGLLAGNPDNRCILYDSAEYQSGTLTCEYNETLKGCEVITAACVEFPDMTMFQTCEGTGQGDCEDGLECFPMTQKQSICLLPCLEDTACSDMDDGPGACILTTQSPTDGHCFKKISKINEPCGWDSFSICAEDQGQCTTTKINLISSGNGYRQQLTEPRCKSVCDPTTANACGAGGSCFKAPNENIMGVESSVSYGVAITSGTSDDFRPCDSESSDPAQCSDGFECIKLRFNNGSTSDHCTLFEHWCGETAKFCDAFDRVGKTSCSQQSPCNISPKYDMCAVVGATDTPANTTCWGSYQIDGEDLYPMCVATCESSAIKNSAGDDLEILDCGTGYTCGTPAEGKELSYIHQSVVDSTHAESATCNDDSDCDTSRDFVCVSAGSAAPKKCNRSTKVCIAD